MIYFYFSGLSLKEKELKDFHLVLLKEIIYLSGTWIQKYKPQRISSKKKKALEYICIQKNETAIKIGS